MPCKITKNALPIFCALATVRVVPLYQLCRIVGYLCVASPCHIAGIVSGFVKKSEFWKFFLGMNPVQIHSIIVTMTESIIMHAALHLVTLNSCSWGAQGLHRLQTQGISGISFGSQKNGVEEHRAYTGYRHRAFLASLLDHRKMELSTGLTLVTDTGHFWQLFCITEKRSWISWLKTTYGHFLDTQIHTSNKRTFANTAQMMMKLCLEALHCSDCMMI